MAILRVYHLCLFAFFHFLVRLYSTSDDDIISIDNHGVRIIVAADGSGHFTKIMDAIAIAPNNSPRPFAIHIRKGVYKEYVTIAKPNIILAGEGIDKTVLTGFRSSRTEHGHTADTATVKIRAPNFKAMNLTIENTSPHTDGPAVALSMDSDKSVLYHCAIRGNQDTLYAYSGRQFYKHCTITGTVDFIFGYASAVFQNCDILARSFMTSVVAAHGRDSPHGKTGFVLQFCTISKDFDFQSIYPKPKTFLGRPWGYYARTVVMQSFIDDNISSKGWMAWDAGEDAPIVGKPFFAEFMNRGPGANLSERVKWTGYHILNAKMARRFTVERFIDGASWLPATDVPFKAGLI